MAKIHPTAIVDPQAELAEGVSIGAYSIITGAVRIGVGTAIREHTHLEGRTVIGERCVIGPAAYVGMAPQHLHGDPEIGQLIVGNQVTIRETATVHRAIHGGDANATRVGDNCFIMGAVHVAHDCVLGRSVVLAHGALLGGHCRVGDNVFLGGGSALHQYVRIGRLAIVGGNETVGQEVMPFAAVWDRGLRGYNAVGCKRSGMSRESIRAVRGAYRIYHAHRLLKHVVEEIKATIPDVPEIRELLDFIANAKRGIVPSVGGRRPVFDAVGEGQE
jgi:UDP-N-acetylglucosamine acyltransferase